MVARKTTTRSKDESNDTTKPVNHNSNAAPVAEHNDTRVDIHITAGKENAREPMMELHYSGRFLPNSAAKIIEFGTVDGALASVKKAAGFID